VPLISLTCPQKYDLPRGRFLENRLSPRPDNEFKASHAWETTRNKVGLYFANLRKMNLENLVNFRALARNGERGKPHERRTNNNNKQQTSVITTTMEWQTTKAKQTKKHKEKETTQQGKKESASYLSSALF